MYVCGFNYKAEVLGLIFSAGVIYEVKIEVIT